MIARQTRVIKHANPETVAWEALLRNQEPVILRGLAGAWNLVKAGLLSPTQAIAALKSFDRGEPVVCFSGPPEIGGRFSYNDSMTAMNFTAERMPLVAVLNLVEAQIGRADAPSFYVGSTDVDVYLPGLRAENDLRLADPMFIDNPPVVSIWIGNETTASTHYDFSNNIACCLVGRRRFTLFPPDQIANLYPGPLDPTPGGQVVSLVDLRAPDLDRFPKFRDALAVAQVAELEAGDVLFYPAMWWHQVEALAQFNVMMNYWWNTTPDYVDTPMTTLLHALLSLRDRPEPEKIAWKKVFDYYVFGEPDVPRAHIPISARGPLAPMDAGIARRLRALVMNRLNR